MVPAAEEGQPAEPTPEPAKQTEPVKPTPAPEKPTPKPAEEKMTQPTLPTLPVMPTPPPSAAPTPPVAPLPDLTGEQISSIISSKFSRITYCFSKGLEENPNMTGSSIIQFTVEPNGTVSNAVVAASTLKLDGVIIGVVPAAASSSTCPTRPVQGAATSAYVCNLPGPEVLAIFKAASGASVELNIFSSATLTDAQIDGLIAAAYGRM